VEKKLQFGTDGIRGKADLFPFTPVALHTLGQAIARWGLEKYATTKLRILLGHDTRVSCQTIKQELIAGLCTEAVEVIDANVLPTPAILQIMQREADAKPTHGSAPQRCLAGIVISASHNHYTDNGIKIFDAKTGKLSHEDETSIVAHFEKLNDEKAPYDTDKTAAQSGFSHTWPDAKNRYENNITQYFCELDPPVAGNNRLRTKFLSGKKVVLDCANGATYEVAPEIFSALGATVIPIHTTPTGKNINYRCGALHPENLQETVKNEHADIGFAFDGDGDRVIAVNRDGVVKNGDDLLALLLQHPDFANETELVGTIMTNYGFERALQTRNIKLVRTKVGDKYVAAHLEKDKLPLGGEASGHLIIRNYLNTGDGIFVALKVLQAIIAADNWAMETFQKTPQTMINVPILHKKDLGQERYKRIIAQHTRKLLQGRIIVRYSGTENVLRVMVEDQTVDSAQKIAQNLSAALEKELIA